MPRAQRRLVSILAIGPSVTSPCRATARERETRREMRTASNTRRQPRRAGKARLEARSGLSARDPHPWARLVFAMRQGRSWPSTRSRSMDRPSASAGGGWGAPRAASAQPGCESFRAAPVARRAYFRELAFSVVTSGRGYREHETATAPGEPQPLQRTRRHLSGGDAAAQRSLCRRPTSRSSMATPRRCAPRRCLSSRGAPTPPRSASSSPGSPPPTRGYDHKSVKSNAKH